MEAGWCCEHCGHPHDPANGRCLTVHHYDGDPKNNLYTNLVALCQACHLHIQARYQVGQGFLLPAPAWVRKRGLAWNQSQSILLNE